MRKLLGTLYVVSQDAMLSLKNDNVVIQREGKEVDRYHCCLWKVLFPFPEKEQQSP